MGLWNEGEGQQTRNGDIGSSFSTRGKAELRADEAPRCSQNVRRWTTYQRACQDQAEVRNAAAASRRLSSNTTFYLPKSRNPDRPTLYRPSKRLFNSPDGLLRGHEPTKPRFRSSSSRCRLQQILNPFGSSDVALLFLSLPLSRRGQYFAHTKGRS
jgi:hypothetical protein